MRGFVELIFWIPALAFLLGIAKGIKWLGETYGIIAAPPVTAACLIVASIASIMFDSYDGKIDRNAFPWRLVKSILPERKE